MPEIVAEGQPFQSSPAAANDIYASTPPSFSRGFGAMFDESSTSAALQRGAQRGQFAGASPLDRYLTVTGEAQEGVVTPGQTSNVQAPIETPELPADEVNKRYAPVGTKITTQPMREGIAALVGKAKQDEIDRQAVLARFEAAHSWPTNFAVGLAAFALDPVNASTMFIPGFGEEAVAGALGRGLLGRTAGRMVSGATGGLLSQAPLSALKLGLGSEEDSDYQTRDFLRDLFYSAVGGAVLHAGLGALGDTVRPAKPKPLMDVSPETKAAAMKSSIAQILEGRPLDVMPVFDADGLRLAGREADLRNQSDSLAAQLTAIPKRPEEATASEALARLQTVERNLKDENISAEERRMLMMRRDELLSNTNPETLRAQAAPIETRRALENQKAQVDAEIARTVATRTQRVPTLGLGPELSGIKLSALGDTQRQLYQNGYAQGVPQAEFNAANEAIYGIKAPEETQAPETTPATRLAESEKPAVPAAEGVAAKTEEFKPTTPEEKEAQDLEAQWQRINQAALVRLTPEQLTEIQSATADFDKAQKSGLGYDQAAICLDGSGV